MCRQQRNCQVLLADSGQGIHCKWRGATFFRREVDPTLVDKAAAALADNDVEGAAAAALVRSAAHALITATMLGHGDKRRLLSM